MKPAQPAVDYTPAARLLQAARRVVIGGHPLMDGDALGSMLALASVLRAQGREVLCVTQDVGPGKYDFLEGADVLTPLAEVGDLNGYDTAILVDCGAESRGRAVLQRLAPNTRVLNVDHHVDNPGFGDVSIVLPRASSTGEVVYHTLQAASMPLTKGAAEALFVAVVTDTGRFMFSNSTPAAYRIIASLVEEFALDVNTLTGHIYRSKTEPRLRLEAMVAQTVRTSLEGKVVSAQVTSAMLADTGCTEMEANELVTIPKSLKGSMVCVMFREVGPTEVKVSLRSEGQLAVNEIAARFGGGGHHRAAGCHLRGRPIAEAEAEVLETVVTALRETLAVTGGAIIV